MRRLDPRPEMDDADQIAPPLPHGLRRAMRAIVQTVGHFPHTAAGFLAVTFRERPSAENRPHRCAGDAALFRNRLLGGDSQVIKHGFTNK